MPTACRDNRDPAGVRRQSGGEVLVDGRRLALELGPLELAQRLEVVGLDPVQVGGALVSGDGVLVGGRRELDRDLGGELGVQGVLDVGGLAGLEAVEPRGEGLDPAVGGAGPELRRRRHR